MKHWINGEDVSAESTLDVVNPANRTVVARMPLGTPEDVDHAVAAATKALPAWAATPLRERAAKLKALAHELRKRNEDLAQAISAEMGAPISLARAAQAGLRSSPTRPRIWQPLRLDRDPGATPSSCANPSASSA
ncbi:aldehyde dehydrogenase family protein [Amycolatopsis sp. NPDC023774]|uniref:aldehyde dehydrogenase family protein n=1 Tax=Amycolatopsis sp. NPDC023774 TaxID=3155015 RepID=UPI0033DE83DB